MERICGGAFTEELLEKLHLPLGYRQGFATDSLGNPQQDLGRSHQEVSAIPGYITVWGPPGSPPPKTHAEEGVSGEHFWEGL
jgi:hypothetical protein